jgi:hypothetical protein
MGTTNMSSDVLSLLNDIYNEKESASEVEGLLRNLKVNPSCSRAYRKLETREYPKDEIHTSKEHGRVINEAIVPDELIDRLVECARDYYKEKLELFQSISVSGEIIAPWEDNE